MAKPNIQNITTTQTFQNWFDKTNEMVEIIRDSAITASVAGDITAGDASLEGEFTANTIVAYDELKIDTALARVSGQSINFISPTNFSVSAAGPVATFEDTITGGTIKFTTGAESWDIGYDNATDLNFVIESGLGGQFSLGGDGVLTVGSLVTDTDMVIGTNATITNNLSANNAAFTSITGNLTGNVKGDITGDVYKPDGVTKVFENGTAGIPAQFTGNVLGTVSSLTNHTTDSLGEGSSNLYFTTARARNSITAGTGVTYLPQDGRIAIGQAVNINSDVTFADVTTTGDITATGDVTANQFFGDGSQLTGIEQLVKGYIAFNGSTGAVISSSGLSLVKVGTGNYTINILPGYRPPNNNYAVVLGNVDDGSTNRTPGAGRDGGAGSATDTLRNYNSFVRSRSTTSFTISATRSKNTAFGINGDDNHTITFFGIAEVDPSYVTAILLY